MKPSRVREIIQKLLEELEEEDVGISLLTTHYQNQEEINFFEEDDQRKVLEILQKLSEESKHHKECLGRVISHLEKKLHE